MKVQAPEPAANRPPRLVLAVPAVAVRLMLGKKAARAAEKTATEEAERAQAGAAEATDPVTTDGGGGFLSGLFGGAQEPAVEAAAPEKSGTVGCKTGKDGVKRCTVESAAPDGG